MVPCTYCNAPIPENSRRCVKCGFDPSQGFVEDEIVAPTTYEQVGDIRDAMTANASYSAESRAIDDQPQAQTSNAIAFRPVLRPPIALLYILDDGRNDEGELIRIRNAKTIIGRKEGDIVIGHDAGMSGKHIEIIRKMVDGRFRWFLRDLDSTNGTFVRCDRAKLKHNFEVLIGSRRFRFETTATTTTDSMGHSQEDRTRAWSVDQHRRSNPNSPRFVEMTTEGDGQTYALVRFPSYIGTESTACDILIDDDPLVCPHHAKVVNDDQGNLYIEDEGSLNGTWLRIKELPLDCNCSFQCGEQRFLLRFP